MRLMQLRQKLSSVLAEKEVSTDAKEQNCGAKEDDDKKEVWPLRIFAVVSRRSRLSHLLFDASQGCSMAFLLQRP